MSSYSRKTPAGPSSGAGPVDAASSLLGGLANSDVLGLFGWGMRDPVDPSLFVDDDQGDGQQVIVADTGDDMDLWSWLTGQEQAEGGLEGIVDAVEANAAGTPADSVELKSHGAENYQHVASGSGGTISGGLSKDQADQLRRLGALVDEDGEILMAGCNVAKNYAAHREAGDSVLDQIAAASNRSVRAGVAIQLPLDGIEGSSVIVHPDGTYEGDTSSARQVYDVTADGVSELADAVTDGDSGWMDRLANGAGVVGEMAGDYWDIASDVWNGTHEARGWDILSPEQRAALEDG